jgi:hypothetical protein
VDCLGKVRDRSYWCYVACFLFELDDFRSFNRRSSAIPGDEPRGSLRRCRKHDRFADSLAFSVIIEALAAAVGSSIVSDRRKLVL